jgi:hypothetical protein
MTHIGRMLTGMAEDRLLAAKGILEVPTICLPNAIIRENDDDIVLLKYPYKHRPKDRAGRRTGGKAC